MSLNLVAIIVIVLSGFLAFIQAYLPAKIMKIIGPVCLVSALSVSTFIYSESKITPQIKITSYTTNQVVKDYVKVNSDGEIEVFPVQFVTNHKLEESEEIVLFMRIAEGDTYWICGNSAKPANISEDGIGQIDNVIMGKNGDGNLKYELVLAVIKEKKFSAGDSLNELPLEDVICYDQIFLNKKASYKTKIFQNMFNFLKE